MNTTILHNSRRANSVKQLRNAVCVFLLSFLLFTACNPAKQLTNDGNKLAAEGKYEDATSYYYSALLKKNNYKPAKDGLKESAQKVLNDKFNLFRRYVLENKIEQAVKQYQYAVQFNKNAEKVGVTLDWAHEYDEVYDDVKREYSGIVFDEAIALMNQKKYDLAEKKLQQIADIDSNYKNISVLRLNTILEPLYNDAMRLLQAGKYQDAYAVFGKVINLDEDYEDAKARREEALSKATTRIGILPAINTDNRVSNMQLDALLAEQLQRNAYAFVQVVDYASMQSMLVPRGWSAVENTEQAIQAGKSLGLQYVLFTRLTLVTDTFIPKTIEKRTAYEAFTENIPNPYTDTYSYITKFKKVEYTDVYEAQQLTYHVEVALVSCADGKLLFTDDFENTRSDELHKFEYKGNANNLYEQLPQGNYLPPVNKAWRDQFTTAKRSLLSKEVLAKELQREIAQRIAFGFNKALK